VVGRASRRHWERERTYRGGAQGGARCGGARRRGRDGAAARTRRCNSGYLGEEEEEEEAISHRWGKERKRLASYTVDDL